MMSIPAVRHLGLKLGAGHPDTRENAEEVLFGFWIFLMSDAVIFGVLFATYGAMLHARAGGPGPKDLFDIKSVFVETCALLASSFTYGMASLALKYKHGPRAIVAWLVVTLAFGLVFLGFEIRDFLMMFEHGGGPDRSGYASAFFALVPLHGLHVATGCLWMVAMMAQMTVHGVDKDVKLGLLRLGLFWHFLDIVWIAIFTVVYLGGLT